MKFRRAPPLRITVAVALALLVGCAHQSKTARYYAANGMNGSAYEQLTQDIHGSHKGDTEYLHAFIAEFPAVREYGNSLFTETFLADFAEKQSSMEWIQQRLATFCATNSPDDCAAATQRVKDAQKNKKPPKPRMNVLAAVLDQLTDAEREQLHAKYLAVLFSKSDVGVITDRQIENLSTSGSAVGSVAGAAVGSAAYNVNSVSSNNMKNWSYSPWADLGSAILGAVVGSAANKAPVQRYRFRYGIKTLDGTTVSVDDEGQSAIGYPIGSCVYVKGFNQVEDSLCTMTVHQLRAELGR